MHSGKPTKLQVFKVLAVAWLSVLASATWAADLTPHEVTSSLRLVARLLEPESIFLVQAQIAGEHPLNLFLDTGASDLVISEPLAKRLRKAHALRPIARVRAFSSSGKTPRLSWVEVSNVQCGGFSAPQAYAAIADLDAFTQAIGEPLDGIAGLGLFGSKTLVLDFPARRVRLEPSPCQDTNGAIRLPFELQGGVPRINVEWAGEAFTVTIDSGYSGGFTLPLEGRRLRFEKPPVLVGAVANLGAVSENRAARLATNIQWGGLTFERPVVEAARTEFGMIGLEVLRHFVVQLDLGNRELWLRPTTKGPVTWPAVRSPGLSLLPSPEDHVLKVTTVLPNTDAARAGLHAGSRITAVNGEPADQWDQRRWRALIKRSDRLEIEVAEGKQTRRLHLKVATLVE